MLPIPPMTTARTAPHQCAVKPLSYSPNSLDAPRNNQFTLDTNHLKGTYRGSSNIDLGTIGIQKHWRDTVAVKLGGDVNVVPDRLALRGGAFYETAVSDPAYANVDFPGGPMMGGSIGSSLLLGQWEVALAYQLRHQSTVTIDEMHAGVYQQTPASACKAPYTDPTTCHPQFIGKSGPVVNAGTYNATSHFLLLAALYRFGS